MFNSVPLILVILETWIEYFHLSCTKRCIIMHLQRKEKKKKIITTVNIYIQHHASTAISLSDTSTGNLQQQYAIISHV